MTTVKKYGTLVDVNDFLETTSLDDAKFIGHFGKREDLVVTNENGKLELITSSDSYLLRYNDKEYPAVSN